MHPNTRILRAERSGSSAHRGLNTHQTLKRSTAQARADRTRSRRPPPCIKQSSEKPPRVSSVARRAGFPCSLLAVASLSCSMAGRCIFVLSARSYGASRQKITKKNSACHHRHGVPGRTAGATLGGRLIGSRSDIGSDIRLSSGRSATEDAVPAGALEQKPAPHPRERAGRCQSAGRPPGDEPRSLADGERAVPGGGGDQVPVPAQPRLSTRQPGQREVVPGEERIA